MVGGELACYQEKLLNEPFSFFGSRINLSRHEKVSVVKNDLFSIYKGKLEFLMQENKELKAQNKHVVANLFKKTVDLEQAEKLIAAMERRIEGLADNDVADKAKASILRAEEI